MTLLLNDNKRHYLLNADMVDINNAVLCVVEYINNDPNPHKVYFIASYDEIDDRFECDFSLFENMKDKITEKHGFDKYLQTVSLMEKLNYGENKALNVGISVYEIIDKINEKLEDKDKLCSEDIENKHLFSFIKTEFHIEFHIEQKLRQNSYKNIFGELILNEYLTERKKRLDY